jgi:hypothetical protein
MALLGTQEKRELEALILERLGQHYDLNGPESLLEPGLTVGVTTKGVTIIPPGLDTSDTLAQVEVRTLFTALCYLANEGPSTLPRDALATLATEAATATAAQINRIASPRATS